MTKRELSCPWPQVPQETETWHRQHRPVRYRAGSRRPANRTPDDDPAIQRTGELAAKAVYPSKDVEGFQCGYQTNYAHDCK